ncbi:c6 zinc finger domain containing protein [Niveomyces insectorum RCEF 264]|uniref:C6 zinc finger domain containing protein n=1 Tax=Niveomyces insectorum RCEF 264 TaxID=1081102 RepID=A0A167QFD9_9HYPO|nr:c6 zinc finger domain containing protein [Niveomyces insectorum RCEF 264]
MSAETQQAYKLMAIAISLAVDYGITRRPGKGRHQRLNLENVRDVPQGLAVVDMEFWSLEARRAYLGCYHIATWYSIVSRKVSPMPYNDYLYTCAKSLAAIKDVPSDVDILSYLEITHEAEKIYTLFNYAETHRAQYMDDQQIQIYLDAFSAKLDDWRSRLSPSMKNDPCHRLWPWLFEAFMREVSLSGMSRSAETSVYRIRVVVAALESTKTFFDTFLAIPEDQMPSLPTTHWALLGYLILLAAAMSMSTQTAGWNINMARSIIKLDAYIDAVSVRARRLCSAVASSRTANNWYRTFLTRWDAVKASYFAAVSQTQTSTSVLEQAPAHGTTPAPTPAADVQLTPYQLNTEPPFSAELQPGMPAAPPANPFVGLSNGIELFEFAENLGSWMVADFDFLW